MSKRICGRCGSTDIKENSLRGKVIWCNCNRCKYFAKVADFPEQTVFDLITASPEVLTPYFVFLKAVFVTNYNPKQQWISTLTEKVYPTKEEAIAATVAKLKEVVE